VIYALDGRTPRLGRDVYVAPNATVIGDVELGAEVSIWFGAVLRGDVERLTIGDGSASALGYFRGRYYTSTE